LQLARAAGLAAFLSQDRVLGCLLAQHAADRRLGGDVRIRDQIGGAALDLDSKLPMAKPGPQLARPRPGSVPRHPEQVVLVRSRAHRLRLYTIPERARSATACSAWDHPEPR